MGQQRRLEKKDFLEINKIIHALGAVLGVFRAESSPVGRNTTKPGAPKPYNKSKKKLRKDKH